MARDDWTAVMVKKNQMLKIQQYIKTADAKNKEYTNPSQLIGYLIHDFLKKKEDELKTKFISDVEAYPATA